MRKLAGQPQPPNSPRPPRQPAETELGARVRRELAALYRQGNGIERRRRGRSPYPYLVQLTPVGDDGITPEGPCLVVVGKDLSERGLAFYHPAPLPYRRMVALLETAGGTRLAFLIDVTWCRFKRQGWYESGGRFVQATPVDLTHQASTGHAPSPSDPCLVGS
jgi:hypothetical protein